LKHAGVCPLLNQPVYEGSIHPQGWVPIETENNHTNSLEYDRTS